MDKTTLNHAEPTNASVNSGNNSGYFTNAVHKTPSTDNTPVSTPGLKADDTDSSITSKPIPVLLRDFPKPHEDVDVQTMLGRQPGRWTIQGQMEANQRRNKPTHNDDELKAQRQRDLEKAKEDLRAFNGHLRTGSGGAWRP
ncbi:hypothetical protein FZEAL_1319 [Fusarium zealandicum]|uniref:Uncharacterized protein n=1 Tax=Fusarium zealandicum TaxID=1053134 RepID=A0A8H4USZ3_9HYPO|nr:hypothetical protein FZEAL_1319 [Fusarium zealandicum]